MDKISPSHTFDEHHHRTTAGKDSSSVGVVVTASARRSFHAPLSAYVHRRVQACRPRFAIDITRYVRHSPDGTTPLRHHHRFAQLVCTAEYSLPISDTGGRCTSGRQTGDFRRMKTSNGTRRSHLSPPSIHHRSHSPQALH